MSERNLTLLTDLYELTMMQGYYKWPQYTDEVLRHGVLSTGDLGRFDEDGKLHITGRKKELIILGNGKNITPEEIEQKIMANSNDLIEECALVGNGDALQLLRDLFGDAQADAQ